MLKLIAVILFSGIQLRIIRRTNAPAHLGLYTAILISLIGLVTPFVWNWSRQYGTWGLLPFNNLNEQDSSLFYTLFSLTSAGAMLCGTFFVFFPNKQNISPKHLLKTHLSDIRNSKSIPALGFLVLLLLMLGIGDSIFFSETYLEFSGSKTILRLVSAILPAAIIVLGMACFESKFRSFNVLLLFCIFLIQTTRGSRTSIIVLLVLFSILIIRTKSKIQKLFIVAFMMISIQILTNLLFLVRTSTPGLSNLSNLVADTFKTSSQLDAIVPQFGRLLASLTSWAPTVILSISESSSAIIVKNLNPLVGTGTDSFAYSSEGIERLFPYIWVPLSSMGQIYGAYGGFGLFLVALLLSMIASISLFPIKRSNQLSVYSILSLSTYFFQFPLFFQYSSRIWIRVIWFMLLMSALHILKIIRSKGNFFIYESEKND